MMQQILLNVTMMEEIVVKRMPTRLVAQFVNVWTQNLKANETLFIVNHFEWLFICYKNKPKFEMIYHHVNVYFWLPGPSPIHE